MIFIIKMSLCLLLKTLLLFIYMVAHRSHASSLFLPSFNLAPVNLCNVFNEKLQWTVSPLTINGWAVYNKWKCHDCLAISLWIISNHLKPLPSTAFKHAGWFKLHLKWEAIFNYLGLHCVELSPLWLTALMKNN